MLRPGAVDEFALEVHDLPVAVEHPHARRVRHVGHVHRLDVLLAAVSHELLHVLRLDHHRHAFLRLADGEFRGVQTAVLGLHAVEVDVQPVGQFADGDADAAGTEVVRFLDEARHLRTAEQPLELALLGGVALLHLAAAGFERLGVVLLRRAGRTADSVAARAAAEHDDFIARCGTLAADVRSLHGPHHSPYFEAFGDIVVMINLADMGRSQSDLVAVARIARRGLLRNDALGQFSGKGLRHRQVNVSRARHAHRLIDVAAARQRVADGAAQTGRSPAERFDLGRMVVGFVLELQQPLLGPPVDIDVDIDRAGVVLLRDLQIVQQAFLPEVARADGRHIHQAEALVLTAQFAADTQVQRQRIFDLLLGERLLDGDALQLGREGRVAAVVAPVSVEDAQLGFVGIAPLRTEVFHHLAQVVGVHRQTHRLAVRLQFGIRHLPEPFERPDGLHFGLLHVAEHRKVLLTRFDGVDVVMPDLRQLLVGRLVIENEQPRRADVDPGLGIDQPHAVDGRSGALVELPGQILHGDILAPREVERVGHRVGHHLAENRIAALFQQLFAEAEKVVDAEQAHLAQRQVQIGVQLAAQALGLDPEAG